MWIKKLYATFGKLENKTMELGKGLNIVYGENESGKSTWTAFIRAMFYGIATREQKKAGYLPAKEKFAPWSGSPMYGKMELSTNSGDITVERTAARTGVLSKVTSTYDETGADAPHGEELLGVSQSVYERTAFIGQAGIRVTSDADCERRILSGASSGDESVSAGEVINRLKKKQREIRYNKSGILPQLEAELAELSNKIKSAKEAESEIAQISESLSVFKEEEKKLLRAKLIAKAEENKKKTEYIKEAQESFDAATEAAEKFKTAPIRRDFDRFAEKKAAYASAVASLCRLKDFCTEAEEKLKKCRSMCENSPFSGMNASAAEETCKIVSENVAKPEKKKIPVFSIIFFACAAVFVALGIRMWYMFIPALLCAVAAVVLLFENKKKKTKENPLEKFGVENVFELNRKLSEYLDAMADDEKISEALSEAKGNLAKSSAEEELLRRDVESFAEDFHITYDDFDDLEKKIKTFMLAREDAERKVSDARLRVEACKAASGEKTTDIQYSEDETPALSAKEIEDEILTLSEKQRRFEISLATHRAEISDFRAADAEEACRALSEKTEKLSTEYDALTLAAETVNEAETELKNRFSPEIEKKTAEYFKALCGGHFSFVKIKNKEFEMDVSEGIATAPRDGLYLSRGTLDELYFALRLALFDTILPEEDALPMVLDDVFVNFDDERMGKALNLLLEIAEKRQIVMFSCHRREMEFFENEKRVNKIKL